MTAVEIIKNNYRNLFVLGALISFFTVSLQHSYLLFHTVVEFFSIVVAFSIFIVTWNSRQMLDNNYLYFVGIAAFFIGMLDMLHTMTYKGMNIIVSPEFFANQFWIATRFLESVTLLIGFWFLKQKNKLNVDLIFLAYSGLSLLIILSILSWQNFPVCYLEGVGQTHFKIYSEYVIITILLVAGIFLYKNQHQFDNHIYKLLVFSIGFTIVSEFCFTLYISNYGFANQFGHYAKLIAFFLIYKANVETGFVKPTQIIFKNLTESEEKYRTLTEHLPELIIRFNRDLKCIYINSAVKKFNFKGPDFYLGKQYNEMGLPQHLTTLFIETLEKTVSTKQIQEINYEFPVNNEIYFISAYAVPEYGTANDIQTILVVCIDVTPLKQAEQALKLSYAKLTKLNTQLSEKNIEYALLNEEYRAQNENLQEVNDALHRINGQLRAREIELSELNATKDKFFSIIAHDLKNPFNSLIGLSDLLIQNTQKYSAEKIREFAQAMHSTAEQAYTLLENLLEWSRFQTGKLIPNPEVVKPADLLFEIKYLCGPLAKSKNIKFDAINQVSDGIYVDREMIRTVLRNLVTNAIKFTLPWGEVMVETQRKREQVYFKISDTGIGIEPEHIRKLFEMDSKLQKSGTAAEKGTGLGLILCKEFIEKNNGRIWVESEVGKGSVFNFMVPVYQITPI